MIKAILRWLGDAFMGGYEIRLAAKLDELTEAVKEVTAAIKKEDK